MLAAPDSPKGAIYRELFNGKMCVSIPLNPRESKAAIMGPREKGLHRRKINKHIIGRPDRLNASMSVWVRASVTTAALISLLRSVDSPGAQAAKMVLHCCLSVTFLPFLFRFSLCPFFLFLCLIVGCSLAFLFAGSSKR